MFWVDNNYFTFYKYCDTSKFVKLSLDLNLYHLTAFKDKLELFSFDTIDTKPNNKHKIKDFEKRKLCVIHSSWII